MLSDFTPIIKEFEGNNDIVIYPISDLHIGSKECLKDEFLTFKKKLLTERNSYITISGDMMNNGTKGSVAPYDDVMRPSEQKRWLMDNLADIKHKILCVVPGNHEYRSVKEVDDNPLYDVCCKLDLEDIYRDNGAIMIIRIGDQDGCGTNNPTYTGCVIHGSGGGFLTGSAVNKNERFGYAFDGLDFLIVGHTHKPINSVPSKIVIDKHNKKVSLKPFRVITATAWLDYGGYAFKKQLLPGSHCLNELRLFGSSKDMRVTQ